MNERSPAPLHLRRTAALSLTAATVLALLNLPSEELPSGVGETGTPPSTPAPAIFSMMAAASPFTRSVNSLKKVLLNTSTPDTPFSMSASFTAFA